MKSRFILMIVWVSVVNALSAMTALFGASPSVLLAAARLPEPKVERLANGLEVVWFKDDRLPVLNFMLSTRSGTRSDAIGKSGTAELLQVMLERGSAGRSSQEVAQAFDQLGATHFATADDDSMTVGTHGLAIDARALFDLLANQVLKPNLLESKPEQIADFKREKARVLDRLTHLGDTGEALAGYAFRKIIGRGTPYARGGFLTIQEFESITLKDVQLAYHRHFSPKNAVLTIVGRVDEKAVQGWINDTFGAWQSKQPVSKDVQNSPSPAWATHSGEIVVIDRPGLNQAYLRLGFRSIKASDPDHYALSVGNAILGETFNSRLNGVIRDELGLTYGIGSGFSYFKDLGAFSVSSSTRVDAVGKMLSKTLELMRGYASKGPSDQEVSDAKEYLTGSFPLSVATTEAIAMRWLGLHFYGLPTERLQRYVESINKVDAAAVRSALSRHLARPLDAPVIVLSGDARAITRHLKESGFTRIRTLSADRLLR